MPTDIPRHQTISPVGSIEADSASIAKAQIEEEDPDSLRIIVEGTTFLNGDRIPVEQWSSLVNQFHEDGLPNRVVVLAHLLKRGWKETNLLRRAVVDAGGILEEMMLSSFADSVKELTRHLAESADQPKAGHPVFPEAAGPAGNWDLYRASYISDEEFDLYLRPAKDDAFESESCIS